MSAVFDDAVGEIIDRPPGEYPISKTFWTAWEGGPCGRIRTDPEYGGVFRVPKRGSELQNRFCSRFTLYSPLSNFQSLLFNLQSSISTLHSPLSILPSPLRHGTAVGKNILYRYTQRESRWLNRAEIVMTNVDFAKSFDRFLQKGVRIFVDIPDF